MRELKRLSKAEYAALTPEERAARRKATREIWLSKPENMERYIARKKAWREANKEKERASRSVLRQIIYWADPEKSREKIRQAGRRLYTRDPQKFLLRGQRYRALKRKSAASRVRSEEWRSVIEQFGGRCAYCLKPSSKLEVDHVEPIAKGGAHMIENMVPACRSCNSSKNASTLLHWLMRSVKLAPVVNP